MPERFKPENKPFESIEEKQKAKVMDEKTAEMFALRHRLSRFLLDYRKYLPKKEDDGKKKVDASAILKNLMSEMADGKTITEVLYWEGFEKQALKNGWDELKQETEKMIIEGEFVSALAAYNELKMMSGVGETEQDELHRYYMGRIMETGRSGKYLEQAKDDLKKEEAKLEYLLARKEGLTPGVSWAMKTQRLSIERMKRDKDEYVVTHPEAYYLATGQTLKGMKDVFDANGRIVETPYVAERIEKILRSVEGDNPSPVFVHGELGSGKSELAIHVARTRLSRKHLARWDSEHPKPATTDKVALKAWQDERTRQAQPLLVSGHKNTDVEQFLGEMRISAGEAPSPADQVKEIERGWKLIRDEVVKTAIDAGEDEASAEGRLYFAYKEAQLQAYRNPVETKRIMGSVLMAMHEGRPLIIDEINAIPHHVLISLNYFLTKRPDEEVESPYPEIPSFKVKDGFCVLATGNYKPEDGKAYIGRQAMDAAFLSRFNLVHYDYLPEQLEFRAEKKEADLPAAEVREFRRKNELYMMIVTRLLNEDLTLDVPPNSLDDVKRLTLVARGVQDVFSGVETSTDWYEDTGRGKIKAEVLEQNVLSLRHLLRIVDRWKKEGFAAPLETYVYDDYLAQSAHARPRELSYLYTKLQTIGGLFRESDGWPSHDDKAALQKLEKKSNEIHAKSKNAGGLEVKHYSALAVIEKLFGPPDQRQYQIQVPERMDEEPENETELTAEDLEREELLDALDEVMPMGKEADELSEVATMVENKEELGKSTYLTREYQDKLTAPKATSRPANKPTKKSTR